MNENEMQEFMKKICEVMEIAKKRGFDLKVAHTGSTRGGYMDTCTFDSIDKIVVSVDIGYCGEEERYYEYLKPSDLCMSDEEWKNYILEEERKYKEIEEKSKQEDEKIRKEKKLKEYESLKKELGFN